MDVIQFKTDGHLSKTNMHLIPGFKCSSAWTLIAKKKKAGLCLKLTLCDKSLGPCLEGRRVYSSSKWPHSKAGQRLEVIRVGGDAMNHTNGTNSGAVPPQRDPGFFTRFISKKGTSVVV